MANELDQARGVSLPSCSLGGVANELDQARAESSSLRLDTAVGVMLTNPEGTVFLLEIGDGLEMFSFNVHFIC